MKMDINAMFNFSSVAYVSFRHGCFIFIFFDGVCNRHVFPSIYMLNDPRYIVADPRYTIAVLHILSSHTVREEVVCTSNERSQLPTAGGRRHNA